MLGQGLDELIDFPLSVVYVGTGPKASGPDGNDDAVLDLQVMSDGVDVVQVREERHDAAALARRARADHAIALAANSLNQAIRQRQKLLRNRLDADRQPQGVIAA